MLISTTQNTPYQEVLLPDASYVQDTLEAVRGILRLKQEMDRVLTYTANARLC